jgi:hypothetical protein
MKITLYLKVGRETREVVVHCGNGEKSFKWLGLVATQKYALAAPTGTVRCRESVRGASEHAQHHPVGIRLSNGECPIPSAMLSDFLHDGDVVHVDMESERAVNSVGYARTSGWYDEAFKNSDYDSGSHDVITQEYQDVEAVDLFADSAACKVMRNLIRTQYVDGDKIASRLAAEWPVVREALPRLSAADSTKLSNMCRRYYCFLAELFKNYIPLENTMNGEIFSSVVTDANIFGDASAARAESVFRRVAGSRARAGGAAGLDFPAFLAALVVCSQQLHVNTLDRDARVRDSAESLYSVVHDMLLPLIFRLDLNHVTKDIFCSSPFLGSLRACHDDLVNVFEKTASRGGTEPPILLHIEHMADLLVELGLLKQSADPSHGRVEMVVSFLVKSRTGILQGEAYMRSPSPTTDAVDKQRTQNLRRGEDYDFPENVITYPEFVEVCARAGAHKYAKGLLESDLSISAKLIEYREAMEKSINMVADLNRKRPTTPTKQHSRAGR